MWFSLKMGFRGFWGFHEKIGILGKIYGFQGPHAEIPIKAPRFLRNPDIWKTAWGVP